MPESPVMADSLTHEQRVAAIAATLFQDLAELHGLDDVWGHRLHLAAQLHDIGFAEGRKGHHKISMRLIEEDLSLNIHEDDRPWVALLARYHRKAWPSRRHARFDALKKSDRKALRKAASLLRIADALDYTHTGVVGNLAVAVKKRKVIIAVQCSGDCSAEMERVIKKGDLFMHVFGRELECVCQELERTEKAIGIIDLGSARSACSSRPCGRIHDDPESGQAHVSGSAKADSPTTAFRKRRWPVPSRCCAGWRNVRGL
ncbi:MAG: hypothetical protein ACLR7Z_02160 [Bilophila wadsworthia]